MLITVWQKIYPVIIAILFFELIIIVHEGGHFIAARLMKIKVNEFSIGMGPKLFQINRGETKYSLRLILFGGYCSMEGESEESDDEASFANKRVIQRIFVVVAGALMNLLLGFIIIAVMVSGNNLVGTTTIAKFDDSAISNQVLQSGDTIKSIDGMRVYTSTDITTGLTRSADDVLEITVERGGKEMSLDVKFDTDEYEGTEYIKMDFWLLGVEKNAGNVLKETCLEWVSFSKMVFLSLHDILVGRYGLKDMSGPVGAVSIVSSAVKTGSGPLLRIMALLTINIGLFNLFPIPALDGWRLFLLIFEGVFRRKMPDKWEWAINGAGLVILLGLMCVITFSDITKLL